MTFLASAVLVLAVCALTAVFVLAMWSLGHDSRRDRIKEQIR